MVPQRLEDGSSKLTKVISIKIIMFVDSGKRGVSRREVKAKPFEIMDIES